MACWCSPKLCHGHVLAEIANAADQDDPLPDRDGEPKGSLPPPQQDQKDDRGASVFPSAVVNNRTDFDFYCVLDFEATCDNVGRIPKSESEVIEFPSVLLDVRKGARRAGVVAEFQRYCRPMLHPTIYPFCTDLTGITQEMVNGGIEFQQAMAEHAGWLASHLHGPDGAPLYSVAIVTCGSWDMGTCLPNQLEVSSIPLDAVPAVYHQWINIKDVFEQVERKQGRGMKGMLQTLGLPLVGRHHSGIDDSRNLCNLLLHLMAAGANPERCLTHR